MNKKVIVFGASGKTGNKICEQLNEKGIQHIAFVRKGSEKKIKSPNTELFFGNVLNQEDIEKVFTDNEFTDVIISLGSRDLKNSTIRSKGTKNIVDVLNKRSVDSKFHVVSALGVRDSWGQLNRFGKLISMLLIKSAMKDHGLQEEIVVNSSRKFHIVRPVGLKDGLATGIIINQTKGFMPYNDITRADVAKYLIDNMISDKTGFSSICRGNK